MKKYKVTVNGTAYEIEIEEIDASKVSAEPAKAPVTEPVSAPASSNAGGETVTSPMPGNILAVNVNEGDTVKKGDVLMILEAMKMENEIMSPIDGKVKSVNITKGSSVETGSVLCVIA